MRFQRLACFLIAITLLAQARSEWVYPGPDGKLRYKKDPRGNLIMDFSHAGYRGGGVRIPSPAVAVRLTPVAGDNTPQIQAAIDEAAKKAPAAVLLGAGEYDVAGAIAITTSGVVLRGESGTVVRLTGKPHRLLDIGGSGAWAMEGEPAPILDDYVPSGTASFRVHNASRFHAGDRVLIQRPVGQEWIHSMGMDTLVRDAKPQTWIKAGTIIRTDRVIKSVANNRITLDVPVTDALEARYGRSSLVRYSFPGRITNVGVEGLRVEAPFEDVPITGAQFSLLRVDAVEDAWVRDIDVRETQNAIVIGAAAKRVTFSNVRIVHGSAHSGAAAPADFGVQGTQILLDRCSVSGEGTWPVVTQAEVTGPIVVLNFTADHGGISPHQRWATGLLVDHSRFTETTERKPGISFSNRNTAGSGHGWDVGWAVAWNVESPFLLVQQPPGAINWCIGCVGKAVMGVDGVSGKSGPMGTFDSPNVRVAPESLYLAQLRERLGGQALENIGYQAK
jgi:hypothetical protein